MALACTLQVLDYEQHKHEELLDFLRSTEEGRLHRKLMINGSLAYVVLFFFL